MPRPKKNDSIQSTRDRIMEAAIDLFSLNGYVGTSVRDIARSISLNEASLYNHFPNKQAIFDAIIALFHEGMQLPSLPDSGDKPDEALDLVSPNTYSAGLTQPIPILRSTNKKAPEIVVEQIFEGAKLFFSQADPQMMKIWRIILIEQYGNLVAAQTLRARILEAPRQYFFDLLGQLQAQGLLPVSSWRESAADTLASLFFEFSFVSNLNAAWHTDAPLDRERLHRSVYFIVSGLFTLNDES